MARDFQRSQRVAEQLQRELAGIIRANVHDPRVGMVTITEVALTRDLETAKVYFTVLGSQPNALQTMQVLNHAAGFIRSQLGPKMRLRLVPQLNFIYDTSVARGAYLSHLIDEAMATTGPANNTPTSDEGS